MAEEAQLERTEAGVAAVTDGWFVVNVEDAAWVNHEKFGSACIFEDERAPFPEVGYTIAVLQPGQSGGLYHHEPAQEDFLVLSGECLLIVEGDERPLRTGDFFHCPGGTAHILVGAGDGPSVVFMAGARTNRTATYPRDEAALRHGAGVKQATSESHEAYAPFAKWQLGRPDGPAGLPWA
jgi:uncharacterized cupin superfamily protein